MSKEMKLLDVELELLKSDLMENKIYIEVAAVTLFFVITLFLGTEYGLKEVSNRTVLGSVIQITALLLFIGVMYLFANIMYTINKKMERIKEEKKSQLRDWLE